MAEEVRQEQTVRLAPFQENFLADIFASAEGLTGKEEPKHWVKE